MTVDKSGQTGLWTPAKNRLSRFIKILPSFSSNENECNEITTQLRPPSTASRSDNISPEQQPLDTNYLTVPNQQRLRATSSVSDLTESLTTLSLWASHSSVSIYESVRSTLSNTGTEEPDFNEFCIDPISHLPFDILVHIFHLLDHSDLFSCMLVSKSWYEISSSNKVWRDLYYKNAWKTVNSVPQINWSLLYKTRLQLERHWYVGQVRAKVLAGHSDSVYSVDFNKNFIITGSRDKTIKLWQSNSGKLLKTLSDGGEMFHTGSVLCLCADEEILISGSSDSSCIVWDLDTLKPIIQLYRHNQGVLGLSMDQVHIASCSKDGTICVWERKPGFKLKHRFRGHLGPVNAVALKDDLVVSGGGDKIVRIWSISQRKLIRKLKGHSRGLACIQISPCGQRILSGGNDNTVKIWDINTGQCLHRLDGHKSLVRSIDVVDNKIISASYDQTIKVWDLDTGEKISDLDRWHGSWIFSARGDSKRIISSSLGIKPIILDFTEGLEKYYLDLIK